MRRAVAPRPDRQGPDHGNFVEHPRAMGQPGRIVVPDFHEVYTVDGQQARGNQKIPRTSETSMGLFRGPEIGSVQKRNRTPDAIRTVAFALRVSPIGVIRNPIQNRCRLPSSRVDAARRGCGWLLLGKYEMRLSPAR